MTRPLAVSLAVVGMLVSGCAVLPRFVPQCEGEPSQMPCIGACRVTMPRPLVAHDKAWDWHGQVAERTMPNALVIKDHTGQTRCQEVS